ncbi:hypothetical protein GGI12_003426, partial [Dipsacomyces acuminosporus]
MGAIQLISTAVLGILPAAAAAMTAMTAMTAINIDPYSYIDTSQVPRSLSTLQQNSSGEIVFSRRIASARPGNLMHVSVSILSYKRDALNISDIVAALYSTPEGKLVRVLGNAPPSQVSQIKRAVCGDGQRLQLQIPIHDMASDRLFTIYRLALIAPESDLNGPWAKYSFGMMLFG